MEIVGEASDGRDAFEKAEMLQPDIVIMDVSMPLLDGIEATRIICSHFPQIQVIGLSMCSQDTRAVKCVPRVRSITYAKPGHQKPSQRQSEGLQHIKCRRRLFRPKHLRFPILYNASPPRKH